MKKRVCSILLALTMAASLSACGSDGSKDLDSTPAADTAENVEEQTTEKTDEEPYDITLLVRSFADDETSAEVEAKINELAREELNMNVDIIFTSFGNAANQIQLMLSSGEALDVTYVPGGNVPSYVSAGYLIDISEYDISPLTQALGEELVGACRSADGSLYSVATFKEHAGQASIVMRKDLCDEMAIDVSRIKSMEDLTDIFEQVKQAHPEMDVVGSDITGIFNSSFDSLGGDFLGGLDNAPSSTEVVNVYGTDTFKNMCSLMYAWNQAGYVRTDLSTSGESKESVFAAGNTFSYFDAYKPDSVVEKKNQSGFDVYVIPLTDALMTGYNTTVTAYAVAQNSKNPQKAVEFLNWMYTSPEFNNLINWGIDGVDYQIIDAEKGIIDYVDGQDGSSVRYHQALGWNYPNQSIAYVWNGTDPDVWNQYSQWEGNAKKSSALGCTFDVSSVVNEVAACNSAVAKYKNALISGEIDPEEYIPMLNEELDAAGLQSIISLKQQMLDSWLN
ncbi:MAG: ABC transporter substrate-binding protein [Lachnospiraceae bacterium]|nr:ABC transporter substrate-binding protein [Lachnospiraceae bacterium]MBD5456147.1 ABC transporter substrate-binding protein [Lachnospiraceae bacterium]